MCILLTCVFAACAAASRTRGGTSPPLANHPRRGCTRLPATANKFVHILWKNLICDNVASARFCARPRGRGCWRCKVCAHCFREGDAPAGCQVRRAEVVAQAILARRVVAPYGVESLLLTLIWKWAAAGKRHLPLRAQRALKGKGLIRKRGKTARLSPSCAQCGRAGHIPAREVRAHLRPVRRTPPGAHCAPLQDQTSLPPFAHGRLSPLARTAAALALPAALGTVAARRGQA